MTTPTIPALCWGCERFREDGTTCDAFPDGIPESILLGGADHREPVDGDHGMQFEQTPGLESFTAAWAEAVGASA